MNSAETRALLSPAGDRRPVHFVGIGGAGMSALAELLVSRGVAISGCDTNPAAASAVADGRFPFFAGHDPAHVRGARAVVFTAAVSRDNPELEAARAMDIPVIRRADALGAVVAGARTVIAVSGTHGKTTTTALTTDALSAAGLRPTGLAGGRVAAWGGHLLRGADDIVVVEADEYDRSFLSLEPGVAIVTNVEADHLDVYAGLDEIRSAFEQFIRPAHAVVCCADDVGAAALAMPNSAEVVRYGIASPDARLRAADLESNGGSWRFAVIYDGRPLGDVRLAVPGRHNVLNALAAIGTGFAMGIELDLLRPGLEAFSGVVRRFQRVAEVRGVSIVDDYAHHPTEIAVTLEAARSAMPEGRLIAAFQPHLFSRTRDFAREFAGALTLADAVFLADIYPAREAPIPGVTSDMIASGMRSLGKPPVWTGSRADLASALAAHVREGDMVLTLGAGDITLTAHELRELLAGTAR